METTEFPGCVLIGVSAVIRSNTVHVSFSSPFHYMLCLKSAEQMANSVEPDQHYENKPIQIY